MTTADLPVDSAPDGSYLHTHLMRLITARDTITISPRRVYGLFGADRDLTRWRRSRCCRRRRRSRWNFPFGRCEMTANHRGTNVTRWIDGRVRASAMKARGARRSVRLVHPALEYRAGCCGGGVVVGISCISRWIRRRTGNVGTASLHNN